MVDVVDMAMDARLIVAERPVLQLARAGDENGVPRIVLEGTGLGGWTCAYTRTHAHTHTHAHARTLARSHARTHARRHTNRQTMHRSCLAP
jgi:hypothetical protein